MNDRIAYFAICRSRSSSRVLQSIQSVAVGRASSRFRPISIPQLSQYPEASLAARKIAARHQAHLEALQKMAEGLTVE